MPTAPQFWPADPRTDPDTGRVVKYEFLAGTVSTLDVHPAVPAGWLDHTPTALITEGVLKGDAVLTALLRANGVPDTDLDFDGTGDPIGRLRGLLSGLPHEQHLLIVSMIGVAAWHNNPEWRDINLTERRVLVAFDADVATNWDVWHQAEQLWHKLTAERAVPALIDLTGTPAGGTSRTHFGVDDYLATAGTYRALLSHAVDTLPVAPDRGDAGPAHGDWRINDQTRSAEE